jgi:hypothetical protein
MYYKMLYVRQSGSTTKGQISTAQLYEDKTPIGGNGINGSD